MLKRFNLTGRIGLAFILMALIQGLLFATVTWAPFEGSIRQLIFAQNQEKASRISKDISRMFDEKFHILSILSANSEIRSMDETRQQKVLSTMAKSMPEVQLAVLADSHGVQIARWDLKPADHTIQYTDRSYFREVMKTKDLAVSEVLRARSTGLLGVVVASPVLNDHGDIQAVLIINIELKDLITMIQETRLGTSGYAYVVNDKQQVIIDPEKGLIEKPLTTESWAPVTAVAAGKVGSIEYMKEHTRILASYCPVENVNWGVVVEQPYSIAVSGIEKIRSQATFVLLLLVFFSAGVGIIISFRIVRPIRNITQASRQLADGDMKVRLRDDSGGEVGQLVESFNRMAEKLEDRQDELECMVAKRTAELCEVNAELNRIAAVDGLTGLANRRTLDEYADREWRRAVRESRPISVLMIDVDLFKAYNDHYGHGAGDDALRRLASALKDAVLHSSDLVARYGGEEFTAVLPDTDANGAIIVAERLRQLLENAAIPHAVSTVSDTITVSIGISSAVPNRTDSLEVLFSSADKALYEAKEKGRNRIVVSEFPALASPAIKT